MITVSITSEQFKNAEEIFKITDKLKQYVSDKVIGSSDPLTGEEIRLIYEDNPDIITMQIYRRNRWIMECTYSRTGVISSFRPVSKL